MKYVPSSEYIITADGLPFRVKTSFIKLHIPSIHTLLLSELMVMVFKVLIKSS